MSGFPCPCCGRVTLPAGPGDYELCPVCFWEDDPEQLSDPLSDDGANGISLMNAQRIYQRVGAVDEVFVQKVRRPSAEEPVDTDWRMFDPARDRTEPKSDRDPWPTSVRAPRYYWRST